MINDPQPSSIEIEIREPDAEVLQLVAALAGTHGADDGARVRFTVYARVADSCGQSRYPLNLSTVGMLEFLTDPDGTAARVFGVPLNVYRDWIEAAGVPLCGARTRHGRLCRNPCAPPWMMRDDPTAWFEAHRVWYCPTHGGEWPK
jgi:hypothetical protein